MLVTLSGIDDAGQAAAVFESVGADAGDRLTLNGGRDAKTSRYFCLKNTCDFKFISFDNLIFE